MDKQDNQFNNFWSIMDGVNPNVNCYSIGEVISNNPLLVKLNDNIQLDRNDMLIDTTLTSFKIGDRVVFLTSVDQQEFILVCKV